MSSSVSSFFSRDVFLKRQARTRKNALPTKSCPSSSMKSRPLHIIPEEDEPRQSSSSSRSASPMTPSSPSSSAGSSQALDIKAKRRHANVTVSDIRVARVTLVHNDDDISEQNSCLLSAPRPAPRPPTSTGSVSPDPFSLAYADLSFKFPRPPIPTPSSISFDNYRSGSESPTPSMSMSSAPTSPDTRSTSLPTTPSTSDDEFPSYYSSPIPSLNPRRASIKPLVITKHNSSLTAKSVSGSTPLLSSEDQSSDSESDSEWYTREFSKIISLRSPIPPSFPDQPRPESLASNELTCPGSPSPAPRRASLRDRYPSAQLDPAFPRKRRSRVIIPNYPPPPVPAIPAHLRSPSTTSPQVSPAPNTKVFLETSPRSDSLFVTPPPVRRPPPRSSIPADCVFVDESYAFSDDSGSAFSFSLYEDAPVSARMDSPTSMYSQPSPAPSPYPPSFPSSPFSFPSVNSDFEFDFPIDEIKFEADLDQSMMLPLSLPTSPIDLESDIAQGLEQLRIESRSTGHPSVHQLTDAEMFSTGVDFSHPQEQSRALRSKWSSSTLNSVREEHAHRGTSAKLRSYFTGAPILVKRGSRKASNVPLTPMSPSKRFRHVRKESDVVVIGYGHQPVRRRGSVTPTVSEAGSEESSSSASSSGLRRKPIPVEMFLRTGA